MACAAAKRRQRGFSLMEMLVAVGVLTIVLGVVFSQITATQKSFKSEEGKLDVVQESREFLDQFARDVRQAGYPNSHTYTKALYDDTSQNQAVGIVKFSGSVVWFEGDIDGDGNVESVQYAVNTQDDGKCPCTITRATIAKAAGTAPLSQDVTPNANVALRDVMNATPFTAVDANGNSLSAMDVTQNDASTGKPKTYNIRSIRVMLNVRTRTPDANGYSPVITMTSSAKINTPMF